MSAPIFVIGFLVFVLVIGIAYTLYDFLKNKKKND